MSSRFRLPASRCWPGPAEAPLPRAAVSLCRAVSQSETNRIPTVSAPCRHCVTIGVFDLDQIVPSGRPYQRRSMPPHGLSGHAPSQEAAINKTTAIVAFALLLIGSAADARE